MALKLCFSDGDLTPEGRSRINVRIPDNWSCPISCTKHSASFAGHGIRRIPSSALTGAVSEQPAGAVEQVNSTAHRRGGNFPQLASGPPIGEDSPSRAA